MKDSLLRAFPSSAIDDRLGGMLLRDWLAGQALAGLVTTAAAMNAIKAQDHASIAFDAYKIADAMMAERLK